VAGLNTVGKKFFLTVQETKVYSISLTNSKKKFIPVQRANLEMVNL
jgi:hypothetical protein